MKFWAVIPAAGAGRRFSASVQKQYLTFQGQFIFALGLQTLLDNPLIQGVVVTTQDVPQAPAEAYQHWLGLKAKYQDRLVFTAGGDERIWSVRAGIKALFAQKSWLVAVEDFVLVHDGVRPCLHEQDLTHMLEKIQAMSQTLEPGAFGVMLGRPVTDTLKRVSEGVIIAHVDRSSLWQAQTPQAFQLGALDQQLDVCFAEQLQTIPTDECQIMAQSGVAIHALQAQYPNPKLTFADDFPLILQLLQTRSSQCTE